MVGPYEECQTITKEGHIWQHHVRTDSKAVGASRTIGLPNFEELRYGVISPGETL